MSNILINKQKLEEYLSDFHPNKKIEMLSRFENFDFDCGITSFISKMRKIISMPKFGKGTTIYWISRGWSEEEAKSKRVIVKKDPESSPMNINFWLKRGYNKEDAIIKIKSQRKTNIEYWINKGYDEIEALSMLKNFQIKSNQSFVEKLKNEDFRNKFTSKISNNINYWIDMGYSIEEAKKKVSERQSTFSLKKCISKHGEELGKKIWEDRQLKWLNSLKESSYNGVDNKDSMSIESFKKKYGDNWIEKYINKNSFKEKKKILFLISFKSCKDLIDNLVENNYKLGDISYILKYKILEEVYSCTSKDMFDYLHSNNIFEFNTIEYYHKIYDDWIDKYIEHNYFKNKDLIRFFLTFDNYENLIKYMVDNFRITDITIYLQSKLISFFYKTTYEKMHSYLVSIDPVIKSKYGRMRYYNNHLCRSDGEYLIAKFLFDNNIEYVYEKKYENSIKRCDFYLTKFDFYIEYTGMDNIKYFKNKYDEKLSFCKKNNIKCMYSNNIDEIKNKIIELYEI